MQHINRRSVLALLGAAPFAGALVARAGTTPLSSVPVENKSARERIRERHFPNVVLTTHEGRKVRFYDDLLKDKIVLINFMYVRCEGVCPGITANLAKLQKLLGNRLGRDIFMYSFTLKPEEDTPDVLRRYAEAFKVRKGWSFLTGTPADMELLRRKLGFTDPDPNVDAIKSSHIGNVRYGNEPLQLWGSCPGMSKASWIAESIGWVDQPQTAKGEGK
ncbi:MAG TPA: SCO family protein [Pyrinomonadaceae bacterium]|jgi:protein SCO1/2|nr:SCO family protein [Pyrinomonadaceae bacterium]